MKTPSTRYLERGFSLTELMIVIIIVGVLAAFGLPAYQDYSRASKRSDAHEGLLRMAQLQERFFTDNTITSGLGGTKNMMNSSFGARFVDADNNGTRDLLVNTGHILDNIAMIHAGVTYAAVKQLYQNLGDGTFIDVSQTQPEGFLAPRVGRGLAVGDYDNDGFPDFVTSNNGERGQLFRNSGVENRHWLGVRLIGVKSARDGTGARLKHNLRGPRISLPAGSFR